MRPQKKIYLSIIFYLILSALMSGGCVYNDSPAGCGDTERLQGSVPVRFTLKLDGYGSRADGGGVWNNNHEKEIGTRFDSEVDRLHVMLIGNDGSLAHVDLRQYMYDADADGYTFIGNIDLGEEGWEPGSYRVMLLANCGPALMSATTLNGLKSTIADVMWYSPNGSPRNGVRIPMWGMTTHDFTFTGKKDSPEEIGSIDLLRALAKVEIKLDPAKMEGYRLVSASISAANSYIDPFPAGWETAAATLDGTLSYGHSFNPVKTPVSGHDFAPGIYTDEEEGSIVFYLPEYDSSEAAGGEATIDVTVKHEASGQTLTYPAAIHFNDANVNGGGTTGDATRLATDIVRNHYYLFTIDGIHFGTLTYDVDCWDYIPSTLGWDVKYSLDSEDSDARYGYITAPCFSNSNNNELKNSSSQFTFSFTLTEPEGATWKAFLLNPDGSDHLLNPNGVDQPFYPDSYPEEQKNKRYFRFAAGNDDTNLQRAVSTGIARDEPYKIAIDVDDNLWTDLAAEKVKETEKDQPIEINENGKMWRDAGIVPTVYLVIKVALDGEHYTEELAINPEFTPNSSYPNQFFTYKFAGTKSRIELRQLFLPKYDVNMAKIYRGIDGILLQDLPEDYKANVWWRQPSSAIN